MVDELFELIKKTREKSIDIDDLSAFCDRNVMLYERKNDDDGIALFKMSTGWDKLDKQICSQNFPKNGDESERPST